MNEYGETEGSNFLDISIKAGIGLGILAVGYVGGAIFGKTAAMKKAIKASTEESNEKIYKMSKGKKVEDIFSKDEIDNLEKSIMNGREKVTKKTAKTSDN